LRLQKKCPGRDAFLSAVSSYRRACPELVEGLGHPLFHAEKPGQAAAESRKEFPPLQFSFLNIKDTGHYQKKVAFDSIAVAASGGRGHLSRMIMSRMMCGRPETSRPKGDGLCCAKQ